MDKRSRLTEAADELVYRQGLARTTLAEIAAESAVPLGNVYYYFKTKEALAAALIERRASWYQARRTQWDADPDPRARLCAFVRMTADNSERLAESGCPIGSLCQELDKQGGPLAEQAGGMFTDFLRWLEEQFRAMGKAEESPGLARHLLSSAQGAALLANTFREPGHAEREAEYLTEWIMSL